MKISTSSKVHVFKSLCFLFCDSYFRVLVLGHENLENLDLAKIWYHSKNSKVLHIYQLYSLDSHFKWSEKDHRSAVTCILSHVRLELSSLYTYVQQPTYMPSYLLRILLHEHEGLTFVSQMGRWETLGQRVCLGGCCCTLLSIVGQHFCIGEEYILSQL